MIDVFQRGTQLEVRQSLALIEMNYIDAQPVVRPVHLACRLAYVANSAG